MVAALLTVESPAPIATLPAPRAIVKVGPPLSCRGPSRGSPVIAPDIDPSSTRLLVLVPMVPPLVLA